MRALWRAAQGCGTTQLEFTWATAYSNITTATNITSNLTMVKLVSSDNVTFETGKCYNRQCALVGSTAIWVSSTASHTLWIIE